MPDQPRNTADAVRRALKRLGVTTTDIRQSLLARGVRGRPSSAQFCPLANYLREELPDVYRIRVGSQAAECSLGPNAARTEVPLDPHQSAFVNDFDHRSRTDEYRDLREDW